MDSLISRAPSSVAPNAGDLMFHASEYKTYVHSLSFGDSFVSVGSLQWPHGWDKSASRLLGHPVVCASLFLRVFTLPKMLKFLGHR